ncbi:hypothetical protein PoB_006509200 [Plakobranchus ocellatus]|uniref:EGF-like domain-containing protein n=1 Tax=Plakobranchus ocellatus TaxID=259542 RepID=A0AAV4D335_9GAST|nr:hypothetical protein PoB_006509200 [Plakobranchus ocellatus]
MGMNGGGEKKGENRGTREEESRQSSSLDNFNKVISSNNKVNSRLEIPTLKEPSAGSDFSTVDVGGSSNVKDSAESKPSSQAHDSQTISKDLSNEAEEKPALSNEDIESVNSDSRNVAQNSENVDSGKNSQHKNKHKDMNINRQRPEIHRQKKVVRLRQLQNPDLTAGVSPDSPQQRNHHQLQQQLQEQDKGIYPMRELLAFEPEIIGEDPPEDVSLDLTGVEEIFVREGEEIQGPIGPDCPPESNRWECLMFSDDLVAVRKDRNLSGATDHRRVKRQSNGNENGNNGNGNGNNGNGNGNNGNGNGNNGNGNGNNGNGNGNNEDDDVDASGDGNDLYPDSEDGSPKLALKNTITFNSNGNVPFDETSFSEELQQKLQQQYSGIPGFTEVIVDSVRLNPDGTVEANVTLNVDSGPAEYSQLTNDEYLDQLFAQLDSVGQTTSGDLEIGGRSVVTQTDPTDLRNQAASILNDPCSVAQCSLGFHMCQVVGDPNNRQIKCEHKCETFETVRNCEHGSTCELDGDYEPFCACTKRWTGTYCQQPVKDKTLDEGEITGVAAGAALMAVGVIGTAAYLIFCRRRNKDPVFSHYSDEEGSDQFSNPSSKLSNFVIDRPRISVTPINTFSPRNGNDLTRRSSSGNSGPPLGPSAPRYSNA